MIEAMISSTVRDLLPDRQALLDAFERVPFVNVTGAEPVDEPPRASSPYAATIEMADRCHVYFLVMGRRYGYEAREGKSATELEFDAAYAADPTKILVFQKRVRSYETKQKDLIRKIGDYHHGYWVTKYREPEELGRLAIESFATWLQGRASIGYKLNYFDHFVRMAIQRSPVPGAKVLYSVRENHVELEYRIFGRVYSVHFDKSKILNDFWGTITVLDETFAKWKEESIGRNR